MNYRTESRHVLWNVLFILIILLLALGPSFVTQASTIRDVPPRTEILLISNGVSPQELTLENYIEDFDAYNLSVLRDDEVDSATDFTPYDIIILTGFASEFSPQGIQKIQDCGVPILVIEHSSFHLTQRLGLVTSETASEETGTKIHSAQAGINDLTWILGVEPKIYRSPSRLYTIPPEILADGVAPIMIGPSGNPVVVLDREREILVSGISEFHQNTVDGWFLFDLLLRELHVSGPDYKDHRELPRNLVLSGLETYLDKIGRRRNRPIAERVRQVIWKHIIRWNFYELVPHIHYWVSKSNSGFVLFEGQIRPYRTSRPLPHHTRCGFSVEEDASGNTRYSIDRWFAGQSWWGDFRHIENAYPGECSGLYYPDCPTCNPGGRDSHGVPSYGDLWEGYDYWADARVANIFEQDAASFHEFIQAYASSPIPGKYFINSYMVRGVDMGANVRFYDRNFFYFGDTWGWRAYCEGCEEDAYRNETIAISQDENPEDGIDITFVTAERPQETLFHPGLGAYGVNIPGVHQETDDRLMQGYWHKDKNEPKFSIANHAAVLPGGYEWLPATVGGVPMKLHYHWRPKVLVWYTTASSGTSSAEAYEYFTADPSNIYDLGDWNVCTTLTTDCDDVPTSRKNPVGWLGCSYDGIRFFNCYEDEDFDTSLSHVYPPFSSDDFYWGTCTADYRKIYWNEHSKFILGAPVFVYGSDLRRICEQDSSNLLCEFYTPGDNGGMLVYGQGRPLSMSPLYLAFIESEDLHRGRRWESLAFEPYGRPVVHYYSVDQGDAYWSIFEDNAAPVPQSYWNGRNSSCYNPEHMYDGVIEDTYFVYFQMYGEWPTEKEIDELYDSPSLQQSFEQAIDDKIQDYLNAKDYESANTLFAYKYVRRYQNCSRKWDQEHSEVAFHFSPETCYPIKSDRDQHFRVNSAIIIREPTDDDPRIFLLGTKSYRWAWLKSPWDLSDAININQPIQIGDHYWANDIEGYGTFLIDGVGDNYIQYDEEDGILSFWVTISSWKGPDRDEPYGIYTKEIKINWPPP